MPTAWSSTAGPEIIPVRTDKIYRNIISRVKLRRGTIKSAIDKIQNIENCFVNLKFKTVRRDCLEVYNVYVYFQTIATYSLEFKSYQAVFDVLNIRIWLCLYAVQPLKCCNEKFLLKYVWTGIISGPGVLDQPLGTYRRHFATCEALIVLIIIRHLMKRASQWNACTTFSSMTSEEHRLCSIIGKKLSILGSHNSLTLIHNPHVYHQSASFLVLKGESLYTYPRKDVWGMSRDSWRGSHCGDLLCLNVAGRVCVT